MQQAEMQPGERRPRLYSGGKVFRVRLDRMSCIKLFRAAEKRRIEPEAMLHELSKTVLMEELVDAVLDDGNRE